MKNKKPDVLFFMVDQMGAKWLDAAMNGICELPNLKRIKSMGVTFSNAFANNPVCCPARATIATGLSGNGHGLLSNGYRLNPEVPTFMNTLKVSGYNTGAFGKIHFYPFDSDYYPYSDYTEYGWNVVHNTEDTRVGEWHDMIKNDYPEHYEAMIATPANWNNDLPYYKGELGEKMKNAKDNVNWPEGTDAGNKTLTEGFFPLPFPEELSQTNWITDKALEFIDSTSSSQPLYTHISYVQPHPPFCPPKRFLEYVNEDKIPLPLGLGSDFSEDEIYIKNWLYYRKLYFADFVHIDEQIGRVLDRMEELGRLENTYIIFTSDHGEMLMDHNKGGKSCNHYEAVIRIPLIIAGPDTQKGLICRDIVQHQDICPTILDFEESLLVNHPKKLTRRVVDESVPTFFGHTLMPLCKGEKCSTIRKFAFAESFGSLCEGPYYDKILPHPWKKSLRNERYRYSVSPGRDEGEELFDLQHDPGEFNNLVNDPEYQEIRQMLKNEMLHAVMLQNYPLPPRDLLVIGAH